MTAPTAVTRVRPSEALEQARERIEPFLPPGLAFNVVMSDVYIATRKNPDLLKCDPESLVLAVCEIQQRGLRVGVTAHLVPKGGKVCAWNDIRGDIEMIVRSGAARDIEYRCVYEGEHFEYTEGVGTPHLVHHVSQDPKTRGKMKGAYAIFYITTMRARVHWMLADEINAIRQKHSLQWKSGDLQPWYAWKTVIRQGAKYLPKNPALARAYAAWEQEDATFATPALPTPQPVAPALAAPAEYDGSGVPDELLSDEQPPFQDDRDIADELPLGQTAKRSPSPQSQGR